MSHDTEYKLARALAAAHLPEEVAPVVLEAIDGWVDVVASARDALEQQQRSDDDLRRFYTVKELMLLLRRSDSGVRALLADGTLPATRVGDAIRVPIDAVETYLAQQTSRAEQPARRPRRPRRTPADEQAIQEFPWLAD